jgi:hypothetical protein
LIQISPVKHIFIHLSIGIPVDTAFFAISTPPLQSKFFFNSEDLCPASLPAEIHLTAPNMASLPDENYYPLAPHFRYELVANAHYKRGYMCVTNYNVFKKISRHKKGIYTFIQLVLVIYMRKNCFPHIELDPLVNMGDVHVHERWHFRSKRRWQCGGLIHHDDIHTMYYSDLYNVSI